MSDESIIELFRKTATLQDRMFAGEGFDFRDSALQQQTIFSPAFVSSVHRLEEVGPPLQPLLTDLLREVIRGWAEVRRLHIIYMKLGEPGAPGTHRTGLYQFLAFIDADVVDTFRSFAIDAATLVLGDPREQCAEVVDGYACQFYRYLNMLSLGAASPLIPAELRETVEAVWTALDGWYPPVEAVLMELGRLLDDDPGEGGSADLSAGTSA